MANLLARALLGSVFINGGLNQLKGAEKLEPMLTSNAERLGVNLPVPAKNLVAFNGAAMMAGGSALAAGIMPRTAALGLVASLVPTTLVAHRFWETEDPGKRFTERNGLFANLALCGGLLAVAFEPRKKK